MEDTLADYKAIHPSSSYSYSEVELHCQADPKSCQISESAFDSFPPLDQTRAKHKKVNNLIKQHFLILF